MRLYLKMVILLKYGSQAAFARSCAKTDDWVSRLITGRKDPNKEEKKLIRSKLGENYGERLFHFEK